MYQINSLFLDLDTLVFTEEQQQDSAFLTNEAIHYLMGVCGYDITYDQVKSTLIKMSVDTTIKLSILLQKADALRDIYFTPDQLGNWEAMAPGMTDVKKYLIQLKY